MQGHVDSYVAAAAAAAAAVGTDGVDAAAEHHTETLRHEVPEVDE